MDFRQALEQATPGEPQEDAPMSGPSSVLWLLKYMLKNGGSPMSFHAKFMSETRLDYSAVGTSEHMTACKFFEILCFYDMLDPGRLQCAELIARIRTGSLPEDRRCPDSFLLESEQSQKRTHRSKRSSS